MNAPPYFMSKWVKPLLDAKKTILTVSVELSEEEAEKLHNANLRLVRLNPTAFFSVGEYDTLYVTEKFVEKCVKELDLETIVEKLRKAVKDLPISLSYWTLRFEHCSAKDVAYHLFNEIVPDVVGVTLAPSGQAFACHRSRMDVLLILSLLSERVLMMDREYKELRYRYIHLRPLVTNFDVEWRLFYIDNRLVAVSQYYVDVPQSAKRYYYAISEERAENIVRRVIESAEEARKVITDVLNELKNYVIDVMYGAYPSKIEEVEYEGKRARAISHCSTPAIDINPLILEERDEMFATQTYTGLFTLEELKKLAEKDSNQVPVRYLTIKGVQEIKISA